MKKLFMSLAAATIVMGCANAATLELNFVENEYLMERGSGNNAPYISIGTTLVDQDGITISNTSSNTNGLRLWSDGLRFYRNSSIKIEAAGTITKITAKGKGGNALSGIVYGTDTSATVTDVWTGSAKDVTMSSTITSSNTPLTSLTIEYEEGSLKSAGLSFEASTFYAGIGGSFVSPVLTKETDASVTYSSSNDEVATVSATGEVKIVGKGTTEITAQCAATAEYYAGSASYTLYVVDEAKSIADMINMTGKTNAVVLVDCELTVTYANGLSVYVVDGTGNATLLYGDNNYSKGDVIPAGWGAIYASYGSLPEFKGDFPAATGKIDVDYPVVDSVSLDNLYEVVILKKVTFEETTPANRASFTGILSDNSELTFYNSFNLEAMAAGSYNVTVVVTSYNNALQVYPIEYAEVADEEPTPLYVVGANVNGNAWTTDAAEGRMTYLGNGIYEWKGETLASEFKLCNGTWAVNYGGNGTAILLDEEYRVYEDGGNISISDFVGYILTDPVVIFDYNNLVIKVSGTKTSTELTWYVAGDFNNWALNEDTQMKKKENGEYELSPITISADKTEGGFKVVTTGWGNQHGVTEVTNEKLSVVLEAISGEGGNAPYSLEEGTYSVKWNPETATVTFEVLTLTGVEGIDADDAEAEYYNLQGVKVANPTNGIYVKVSGGKAVKTVVAE